jgi:3D (Asp-Asp-Asp) domain-containing protein
MPHRHPHKPAHHVKPNYKRLALIAAAAAVLSATPLSGMAGAMAQSTDAAGHMHTTTSQQAQKIDDSQVATSRQISLQSNTNKPHTVATQHKQQHKTTQVNKHTNQSLHAHHKLAQTHATTTKQIAKSHVPASNNAPNHYQQVLNISATAYAPGAHDNDQWGDKTFTGTQVRPGIIAVDPHVIPLGSRVYIEYPDGHGEYVTAEDTGGAIKGNRIDIAKQTVHEAENFGIQNVRLYVVESPHNA